MLAGSFDLLTRIVRSRLNGRRASELVRALPSSFDGGRRGELGLKCAVTSDASEIALAGRVLPFAFHYDLAGDDGNVAFERATVFASRAVVVHEISTLYTLSTLHVSGSPISDRGVVPLWVAGALRPGDLGDPYRVVGLIVDRNGALRTDAA
jgi:hypothetical protein